MGHRFHQTSSGPAAQSNRMAKQDAVSLLIERYNNVRAVFRVVERMRTPQDDDRIELIRKVSVDLLVQMAVEESVFYPALSGRFDEPELIDHAVHEHEAVRKLIMQLIKLDAADPLFEPRIRIVRDYVEQMAREKQSDLFQAARDSDIDLVALRQELEDTAELMLAHYVLAVRVASCQADA